MTAVEGGLRVVSVERAPWAEVVVNGAPMHKAAVFEGNYDVRSAFFRLAAGEVIPRHNHKKWVQVFVVSGCMKVEQLGAPLVHAMAGTAYFLDPGFPHVETAEAETVVLVTQGEDRPGFPAGTAG